MKQIKIPRLKCVKCNHQWTPRNGSVNVCPKCHTKYWDKKYKR